MDRKEMAYPNMKSENLNCQSSLDEQDNQR